MQLLTSSENLFHVFYALDHLSLQSLPFTIIQAVPLQEGGCVSKPNFVLRMPLENRPTVSKPAIVAVSASLFRFVKFSQTSLGHVCWKIGKEKVSGGLSMEGIPSSRAQNLLSLKTSFICHGCCKDCKT